MPSLVWLASYPKSGNTWLRLLLSSLMAGEDSAADINDIRLNASYPVLQARADELSLIDSGLLSAAEADRLRPLLVDAISGPEPLFAKVHDAYRHLPDGTPLLGRGENRAAVYILRDPRDVAVSLSHHMDISLDEAVRWLCSDRTLAERSPKRPGSQLPQRLLDWSSHVRSWTGQSDLATCVVRFEDLLADTVGTFGRVISFLGLPASHAALARAVRACDFNELRRQEAERGFAEKVASASSPFFREGRAGGWANVLAPSQAHAIQSFHEEVMSAYGYV